MKLERKSVYFPPDLWNFLLHKSIGATESTSDLVVLACLKEYGAEFKEFLRTGKVPD